MSNQAEQAIDFEIVGDVPLIERPIEIHFFDNRIKKPVKFLADWKREDPKNAHEILREIMEREQNLEGSGMIEFQEEQIRDRLVSIKEFPTKTGKKINAGPDEDYSLSSVLDSLMGIRAYQSGLYQSMLSSLTERDLFDGKRKN